MHQIQLSDELYQELQARAADAGFASVDDYVADVLEQEFEVCTDDLPDEFFTAERLAQIAEAEAQIARGEFYTLEEMHAELEKRRAEWIRKKNSERQ